MFFTGDRLAADVEAIARHDRFTGYLYDSSARTTFTMADPIPATLTVYVYRQP